jgi:hypothetical protein
MTDQELKDLVASLAEDRKKSSEKFDRGMEEIRLLQAETARRMEENARQLEELRLAQKETDRQMKETDIKIDKVSAQIGGVSNNMGFHAEQFFQDAFDRKREFGGIKYNDMVPNFGINKDSKRKMEIDIALINGDSVALIEAKNRIHPDFVKEFAEKRVGKFRTLFPDYKDHKIYLGIASFSFDKKALDEAKEFGIGIVKQVGDEVEMDTGDLKVY